jgi:CheY-like chemotaxis protein
MGISNATESPIASNTKSLIFVVDDEPILLELAVNILEMAGYATRAFSDPGEALRTFKTATPRPALIVTDYSMGIVSGTDLIRECRRIHPAQKIILLSGTADESVFTGVPDKPDRFMAKPYTPDALIELVRSVLGN